ncbi:hypothetical protein DL765_007129 [Monosporascus sp. GIB2]|nr:hypothetical protein DL765_007129 [Monosporascus sp. GIB2]
MSVGSQFWDGQNPCVQAILDGTLYWVYANDKCSRRDCVCEPVVSNELSKELNQRATILGSALQECSLGDNHHNTAGVLLSNYCHSMDVSAFVADRTQPELGIPSKKQPPFPSADGTTTMEPMGFGRVLMEYRFSECALDVLNDLDWLAFVSLGYSSREHLCFPRNTVPAILLQEAEARAQVCESPDDVFAVLDVMHSYCHSQESIRFRPESPSTTFTTVTTTIIPTVTITCTVTRTPTPALWARRIMEAAGVCNAVPDTASSAACCSLWICTYALIAFGPACFLAATAGALVLELAWKLLKPQPSKADHTVGNPPVIKIGATSAGDPTPSHDPNAEASLRAYGWALLLAAAAYCLVIWFVSHAHPQQLSAAISGVASSVYLPERLSQPVALGAY